MQEQIALAPSPALTQQEARDPEQDIKMLFDSFLSDEEPAENPQPTPEWNPDPEIKDLFDSFASGDEGPLANPHMATLSGVATSARLQCSELVMQQQLDVKDPEKQQEADYWSRHGPLLQGIASIEGTCSRTSACGARLMGARDFEKAQQVANRISKQSKHQRTPVRAFSLNSWQERPNHLSSSGTGPQGPIISHHISTSTGRPAQNQPELDSAPRLQDINLKVSTYNIRGLKRFGRHNEISHLIRQTNCSIIGIQETKSTGNTITTLADGYLLNSSDNPLAGKEEHRGTGLIFQNKLPHSLFKTYQGSSRWCGAVFATLPVPILALSVYAPTAATPVEEKEKFYQEIGEIIAENGGAFVIILGDFNARILTDPGLPRHIGDNILQAIHPLGTHSEEVLENRDLFLDFLIQHDLVALNTLIADTPEKQITYRYPFQPDFTPPWIETNYAQIDYILTKARFRNDFAEVRPQPKLDYDSDHMPILATLKINWRFGKQQKQHKPISHSRTCQPDAKRRYNEQLSTQDFRWENVREKINNTALGTRGIRPPTAKKPYITQETMDILANRDAALTQGNTAESKRLTNLFRRQVKRDRKNHITEQLRTFTGAKQNWPAIKKLRSKFTPRFSKRGTGRSSIPANFPNDCAEYFAHTHWKTCPPTDTTMEPPLHRQIPDSDEFTIEELNEAIDNLKRNKTGGPDGLITELLKDMDNHNRTKLLALYNEIYRTETIPDHFNEALVVQIYKPGKIPENYASYRPIALLNITYKILAKMLQKRLRDELDERIVPF